MKKMNNKGFSLVELIIVIAIMAILIAVLAPQYIKYVEKSRQSADLDNYQSIVNAIQVAYADVDDPVVGSTSITVDANGDITGTPALTTALNSLGVDITNIHIKSSLYKSANISATVDSSGIVQISCDHASLKAQLGLN